MAEKPKPIVAARFQGLQSTQDFRIGIIHVSDSSGNEIEVHLSMADMIELASQSLQMLSARGQALGPAQNKELEAVDTVEVVPTNAAISRFATDQPLDGTDLVFRLGPDVSIGFRVETELLTSLGQLATKKHS
ncbi:hypothetical protein [Martelella limonii]|uniref:hypothetical protein n=1 Tax=Martelella limonii TaxID=1647649 RepID=UPI0015804C2A|nr:hypothetical protein [Martelella limonii]